MRLYTFTNMYLSSLQHGIQSAHCLADMFVKYGPGDEHLQIEEWALNHKTMIILNGGYNSRIRDLREFFDNADNPYPWADFHEGEDSLDGALTCVGIVLPEKIYETARLFRQYRRPTDYIRPSIEKERYLIVDPTNEWNISVDETTVWEYTPWELELCDRLNSFDLAR